MSAQSTVVLGVVGSNPSCGFFTLMKIHCYTKREGFLKTKLTVKFYVILSHALLSCQAKVSTGVVPKSKT